MHKIKGDIMITVTELEKNKYEIACDIHLISKISNKADLKRNSFCTICRREAKAKELEKQFKLKASEIHNNKYNYDKSIYVKSSIPLTIRCILHDIEFEQRPSDHLTGKIGCKQCIIAKQPQKQSKSQELFIEQANKVHRDYFDYSDVEYKNTHTHVKIKCKKHNHIFTQTPAHHLSGKNGCEICKNKGLIWSRKDFINMYSHKQCTFYLIQCHDEHESFYKLGITSKTVKQRYNKHNLPYQHTIILEYKDTAENVWDLEYMFKQKFKNYYYKPIQEFKGSSTETFKLEKQQLKYILFHTDNIMIK